MWHKEVHCPCPTTIYLFNKYLELYHTLSIVLGVKDTKVNLTVYSLLKAYYLVVDVVTEQINPQITINLLIV